VISVTDSNSDPVSLASFTIEVVNTNDRPVARDDAETVINNAEPGLTIIDVLLNDLDDDGDDLFLTEVITNGTGTAEKSIDNLTVKYTPETDFNGTEIITYTVSDDSGLKAVGTLEITVVHTLEGSTGRKWMDRNLGALQVATDPRDEDSYGNRYQWGRGNDGHELEDSETSTAQQDNTNTTDEFSIGFADWLVEPENTRWINGVAKGAYDPCPTKFRLPTDIEMRAELGSSNQNNLINVLKFPLAGYRNNRTGDVEMPGSYGRYWMGNRWSAQRTAYAMDLKDLDNIEVYTAEIFDALRAWGYSVRCIQE
jgi:hypothetical protein